MTFHEKSGLLSFINETRIHSGMSCLLVRAADLCYRESDLATPSWFKSLLLNRGSEEDTVSHP